MNMNLKYIVIAVGLIIIGYFYIDYYSNHENQDSVIVQRNTKRDNGHNCETSDECKSGYCHGNKNKTCKDK